jgi:hypothetical protein
VKRRSIAFIGPRQHPGAAVLGDEAATSKGRRQAVTEQTLGLSRLC